ncbi:hypothetical protein EMCRGX_G017355 [Ephydatia muelleri]
MQYKYSDLHEIYLVFLSQFNTLASEVKCLRVIERRDPRNRKKRSKQRADPEKKKAFVCDSYKADPEKKKASVRDSYNADIESKQSAKRQRYQEDVEENRAAKRPKYEDNSAAIKASERNRYWYDPAVRLAKRAAERKRYRRGHRTTTTTQSYSLYEPKSHALMEYNGGLEKAILRDSELDAFSTAARYIAAPLLSAASSSCSTAPAEQSCPHRCPTANSRAAPTSSSRSRSTAATCTSPTTGTSIGTSAPTTTLPAATLAAATTTRMAPMARTRPPRP